VRCGEIEIALPLGGDAQRKQGSSLTEGIAVRSSESESFFAQHGRSRKIAAHLGERRCRKKGIDTGFGRDSASRRQRGRKLDPLGPCGLLHGLG